MLLSMPKYCHLSSPQFTLEYRHLRLSAGLFHLQSFLALLWDERKVEFDSEDEEQLWRMVHRRSGMGRLEFQHAMKLGK